jgi:hypothetical protein
MNLCAYFQRHVKSLRPHETMGTRRALEEGKILLFGLFYPAFDLMGQCADSTDV